VVAVRVRASVGRPGASAAAEYQRRRATELATWARSLPWRVAAWLAAAPVAPDLAAPAGVTVAASQACSDAAALKASVAELDQLDPPQAGKAGIQAALDKVQANLAALKASARSQWSSQITELDGAVEALRTTIVGIDGNSLLSAVPTIVSDLKRIDTAWTALQQQIDQDCG
jgi:hypothetical protein